MRRIAPIAMAATALLAPAGAGATPPRARPAVPAAAAVGHHGLDRTVVPPPGPQPHVRLPSPVRFRFPSGVHLLVIERRTLPMVAVAVVWKSGAVADTPALAGLASLTANLLDEGTERRGPLELAAALQGLGTNLEAGSGWDSTVVSMVSLSRNLDASLDLLADVVLHPAFAEREFERVKGEQLAATQQRRDSAQIVASDAFSQALYRGRYGLPATGTLESLRRITRADVRRFHESSLPVGQAEVIVAGDVDAQAIRSRIETLFGGAAMKAPAAASRRQDSPPEVAPPRRLVIDKAGAPQSEVRIGLPGPPRLTPDYFALLVMNEILGGGDFSNRLNLNLREAHAYTYGAHSGFALHRDGGPFVVSTAARTAVTGPAIAEAIKELSRIRESAVDPSELRFAKDSLQRGLARRFETLPDLVFEVANKETFGLPDDWFTSYADRVEAVTAADVQRAAQQHLPLDKLSMVVVGERGLLAPQLAAIARQTGAFEGLGAAAAASPTRTRAAPAR